MKNIFTTDLCRKDIADPIIADPYDDVTFSQDGWDY